MLKTKAKPKAYRETPGPRNCMRLRHNTHACETCGRLPSILHTPIRAAPRYCAKCCPHCSPWAVAMRDTHQPT